MKKIERFFLDGFITCRNIVIDSKEISENGKLRINAITLLMILQFHKLTPNKEQAKELKAYIRRFSGSYADQMQELINKSKEIK